MFDCPNELYSGTFMGTLRQETINTITFVDQENDIKLVVQIGKVPKKPSDYFCGDIKVEGKTVSRLHGSYLSYISFDDKRYWDYRELKPFRINFLEQE